MPCGDGTGPWWIQERSWRCRRTSGKGFSWRHQQKILIREPVTLPKDEQKKILETELKEIESEKQEITKKLKEIEG